MTDPRPLVTALSGVLGAGKTTLLEHARSNTARQHRSTTAKAPR